MGRRASLRGATSRLPERPGPGPRAAGPAAYRLVAFCVAACHTSGMSENVGGVTTGDQDGDRPNGGRRRLRQSYDWAKARARVVGVLSAVARWVGTLIALLLVLRVVFTLGGANPDNGITRFITEWSDPLALGFSDLFTPADPQLAVLVNYGIAALFWLFITSIAVRIINAFA